jgi:hypothetical protein
MRQSTTENGAPGGIFQNLKFSGAIPMTWPAANIRGRADNPGKQKARL